MEIWNKILNLTLEDLIIWRQKFPLGITTALGSFYIPFKIFTAGNHYYFFCVSSKWWNIHNPNFHLDYNWNEPCTADHLKIDYLLVEIYKIHDYHLDCNRWIHLCFYKNTLHRCIVCKNYLGCLWIRFLQIFL